MATMLISGLWHGLSWHMLVWGGLHGLYQVVERILSLKGPVVPPQKWPVWRQGIGMVTVFVLVSFAWVPFVMELPVALQYWGGMLGLEQSPSALPATIPFYSFAGVDARLRLAAAAVPGRGIFPALAPPGPGLTSGSFIILTDITDAV
jgi:D-alanyl-lipoteichoic acid acyltransferase DltB (MBOAT superfamily)